MNDIKIQKMKIKMAQIPKESKLPPLLGMLNVQQVQSGDTSEYDELYLGYGFCPTVFPYMHQNEYNRQSEIKTLDTIVLENDYLKATFLPMLGGRLWSLYDKKQSKELLLTNDEIQFGNLALRNAWFCGGIEWNFGLVGHSPFTCAPVYCAILKNRKNIPVLRIYEYERIRSCVFQIDFWLSQTEAKLYAAVRIINNTKEVKPVYWWSNIALPEYKEGRIIVPADTAYSVEDGSVKKFKIPYRNGMDISYPFNTKPAKDYFWNTALSDKKYICYVDGNGNGICQSSSSKQQGRKLFVWGQGKGGSRWQDFLAVGGPTKRYIEAQAGLGKTQYECIPMPPKTAWEWVECYQPVNFESDVVHNVWDAARSQVETVLTEELDALLKEVRDDHLSRKADEVIFYGSGWGALEKTYLNKYREKDITSHLDFGAITSIQSDWVNLLENGTIGKHDSKNTPSSYMLEDKFIALLRHAVDDKDKENWYAYMQLAAAYLVNGNIGLAEKFAKKSISLDENIWNSYVCACVEVQNNNYASADEYANRALNNGKDILSVCREIFKIFVITNNYADIVNNYDSLSEDVKADGRIKLCLIQAFIGLNKKDKAREILGESVEFTVDDIREGENTLSDVYEILYGTNSVPYKIDFNMSETE